MKKFIVSGVLGLSLLAAGVAFAQTYSSGACLSISSGLTVGSRGSQVLALQQFLVSQDYPGSGTWMETGYFGAATRAALVDFQQTQGLPQTGVVDATTLSALERVSCGGASSYSYPGYPGYTGATYPYGTTYPYTTSPTTSPYTYPYSYGYGTPTITSLSQNTGEPGQTVTVYGQGFEPTNTVYFGGEALSAASSGTTEITFTIPYIESYGANQVVQLYVTNSDGTSNSVSFTLNPYTTSSGCSTYPYSYESENCGCGDEYGYTSNCSNCGTYEYGYSDGCSSNTSSPTVTYLSPNSGGVGTNVTVYGSGFTPENNTVNFGSGIITDLLSPDGESVSFTVPSQLTGYGSQPIVLGTYNVSVTNSNDITSDEVPFTVTSTTNGTGAPVISSVSGPTNVQTGTQNTWTLTLTGQNSSYVTVSVNWGDNSTYNNTANQPTSQTLYNGNSTISFTHTYYTTGTYTAVFTASNSNGQSNTYTETVNVSGSTNGSGTPIVNYLSPSSGYVGSQVTVYGSNFSTSDNNTVEFGSGAIENVYSNGSSLTFTVPSYTTPYCTPGLYCAEYAQQVTPGTYNVSVMDQYGTSDEVPFTVL